MRPDTFDVSQFPDLTVFAPASTTSRPLRVCIATEEIYGPVRNGGIASTYFYLARLLKAEGHDVTILYLKGNKSENGPIEDWISFYDRMGIRLVPLPVENAQGFSFWQRRHYSTYVWLKNQSIPFDIVHASEWRGGTYYALLAKQQGLAFEKTLFVIKASSPHIWNRHYLMDYMGSMGMLGMMYAEQMSIELGDIVVGGSAHLLSFMDHVGYTLPEGRVHVQPNVLQLGVEGITDQRGPVAVGDTVKSRELAFFARLEARKGLEIFCDALDFIVARGVVPDRVAFLGKEAGSLPSTPHLKNKAYIEMRSAAWPFEIEMHDDFQQTEALNFLIQRPMLAVMPSLVENSTMAVYEALVYKIPFLATAVGGTPELVVEADHDKVLCDANPRSLADGLERILTEGGHVAQCSFDNDENLRIWRDFHTHLSERKASGTLRELSTFQGLPGPLPTLSLCVQADDDVGHVIEFLEATIHAAGEHLLEIVLAVSSRTPEMERMVDAVWSVPVRLVDASEMSLGEAWNAAVETASGDTLMFLRSDIHMPCIGFAATLRRAFASSGDVALSSMWYHRDSRDGEEKVVVPVGNDKTLAILDAENFGGRGVSIRRDCFEGIGGFNPIFGVAGIEQDLLHRASETGRVNVVPEPLYLEIPSHASKWLNQYNAQYMSISSIIEQEPYYLKRLHLSLGHMVHKVPQARRDTAMAMSCDLSRAALVNLSPLPETGYEKEPRMRLFFEETSGDLHMIVKNQSGFDQLTIKRAAKLLATVDLVKNAEGRLAGRINLREIGGLVGIKPVKLTFEVTGSEKGPRRAVSMLAAAPNRIAVASGENFIETMGAGEAGETGAGAQKSADAPAPAAPASAPAAPAPVSAPARHSTRWQLDCGAEQTKRMHLSFDPDRVVFRIELPTYADSSPGNVLVKVNDQMFTGDFLPGTPVPTAEFAVKDGMLDSGRNALVFTVENGPNDLRRNATMDNRSLSRVIRSGARIDLISAGTGDTDKTGPAHDSGS